MLDNILKLYSQRGQVVLSPNRSSLFGGSSFFGHLTQPLNNWRMPKRWHNNSRVHLSDPLCYDRLWPCSLVVRTCRVATLVLPRSFMQAPQAERGETVRQA